MSASGVAGPAPRVSGATRLYGIVGHPVEQVRSPEAITAELHRRGHDGILVPMHVLPDDFVEVLGALRRLENLDGLVFTVPFKASACALADELGSQAASAGAINALARRSDGSWHGELFDGLGCVDALSSRGVRLAGKRVALLGAGGAGTAIGLAVAAERPRSIRLHDPLSDRARDLAERIRRVAPDVPVELGEPRIDDCDVLLNASPVGMLDDARLPVRARSLPGSLVVLDAVAMPERTPLLALAERCGCTAVGGIAMIRAQVTRIVDHFGVPDLGVTS